MRKGVSYLLPFKSGLAYNLKTNLTPWNHAYFKKYFRESVR